MNKFFKPANLLFYFLVLLTFFLIGASIAGMLGAAEGQGLAGGAIVLMYGIITAFLAFVAALFLVYFVSPKVVIQLNKLLVVFLLFAIAVIIMRFRQNSKNEVQITNTKTTVATFPFKSSPFQNKSI